MSSFCVVGWDLIRCHLFAFDEFIEGDDIFLLVMMMTSFCVVGCELIICHLLAFDEFIER